MDFPEFMFRGENKIPASQQNTPDIEGYYYTANDGSQMAFWTYKADRVYALRRRRINSYHRRYETRSARGRRIVYSKGQPSGRTCKSGYQIDTCFRRAESKRRET